MILIAFDRSPNVEEMSSKFRIETVPCKTVPVRTGIVSDLALIMGKINFLRYSCITLCVCWLSSRK